MTDNSPTTPTVTPVPSRRDYPEVHARSARPQRSKGNVFRARVVEGGARVVKFTACSHKFQRDAAAVSTQEVKVRVCKRMFAWFDCIN